MLAAVLLKILVLGACGDTVPEQQEKDLDNDKDPIKVLWKALDLILFPSSESFRDFRIQFITIRFLAPLAVLVLSRLGSNLVQKLLEPCFVQVPDNIDIEKPWSVLTEKEKQQITDNPFKWLGKRYYINFIPRLLYPPLRLALVHVAPCLLVLWYSWTEASESAWQLFVKSVLTVLYGLYLPAVLLLFVYKGCSTLQSRGDNPRTFESMFLLPYVPWGLYCSVEDLWSRDKAPFFRTSPFLSWLYTLVIWGGLGLEFTAIAVLPICAQRAVLLGLVPPLAGMGSISLFNSTAPGFWDYMGAFLGLTPLGTLFLHVFVMK